MRRRIVTDAGTTYYLDDAGGLTLTRVLTGDAKALRRDYEPIRVAMCPEPQVGRRWTPILDLRGDRVLTVRVTSPIVSIEEVASG